MLPIETKLAGIKTDIQSIRSIYSGDQDVLDALDDVESGLDTLSETSVTLTTSQLGKAQDLQSAACLALQMPINDSDAAFGTMIALVAGLAAGAFLDAFGNDLSTLISGPSSSVAQSTLAGTLANIQTKQNQISSIADLFTQFDTVQGRIKFALGVVSTLMGCQNSNSQALSKQWSQVSSILPANNSDFSSGVSAATAAAENFSDPFDIFNDAKNRVTGNMDLDTEMDTLTTDMAAAEGWLA